MADPLEILETKPQSNDPLGILSSDSDPLGILEEDKDSVWKRIMRGEGSRMLVEAVEPSIEALTSTAASMGLYGPATMYGMAGSLAGRSPYEAEKDIYGLAPQPKTEAGKQIAETVGKPFEWLTTPSRASGEWLNKHGYPNLAYGVEKGMEVLLFWATGAGGKKVLKEIKVKEPWEKGQKWQDYKDLETAELNKRFAQREGEKWFTEKMAHEDIIKMRSTRTKSTAFEKPIIIPKPKTMPYGEGGIASDAFLRKATEAVGGKYGIAEKGIELQPMKEGEFGVKITDRTIPETKKRIVESQVNAVLKRGGTAEDAAVTFEKFLRDNQTLKGKEGLVNRLRFLIKSERGEFNFPASEEKLTQAKQKISEIKQAGSNIKNKAVDLIDVEAKYKREGYPETGFNVKNYYSEWAAHEEFGEQVAKENVKLFKHNKVDAPEVVLAAEDSKYMSNLSKDQQERIRPAVDQLTKYFEDSKKEYAKKGVDIDFKKRIIGDIEKLLEENITPEDRVLLEKSLKDAQNMNFVHIPSAMWFDWALSEDPAGAASKLRLLVAQKRKTFLIRDLVDQGIINKSDIHPVDIILSYARRKGRDFALLNILDAAKKEGLVWEKPKPTKGVSMEQPPPGFKEVPAYKAPILAGKYLHPLMRDYVEELVYGRGLDLGVVNKWMSLSKMAAFINPGILPMYDVVQHGFFRAASPSTFKEPYLRKGIKEYLKRGPEYYEALHNGLASKPYSNPFTSLKKTSEWIKMNKREKYIEVAKTVLPHKAIQNAYRASWYLAWEMDKMVRMGSYETLKGMGFDSRNAAQIAAKFHSDYASVPPKIRRTLNIPFFTPTFKITMGKLWGRMMVDAAESSIKLGGLVGKLDPKTKTYAKGLIGAMIINEAWDVFMRMNGFKLDEWGRRYTKDVDTEKGPKELVVTWSSPSNMFLKYAYRAIAASKPEVTQPVKRFFEQNKWEIHPVWRTGIDIFITNKDSSGNQIVSEFDSPRTKAKKQLVYATKNIISLVNMAAEESLDAEARKKFVEESGWLLDMATEPFTFKYLRAPEQRRKAGKAQSLKKLLMTELFRFAFQGKKITPEQMSEFKRRIQEIKED